jgi:hypothetical protein
MNTLEMFFSLHKLISKLDIRKCLIFPHPSFFFYRRRTVAFFCRITCTTDMLTTFRLFYKSGIHAFCHSKFQLHSDVTTIPSSNSEKLRPQLLIVRTLTYTSCISLLLSKKSHQHYQRVPISFTAEYHLQLLVLIQPNLYCSAL